VITQKDILCNNWNP